MERRYRELLWEHKHATFTLCSVFWSFGTCVAFLGPTLLDLGCKTATIFPTMSWVFFAQTLCILLGTAFAGLMLKRLSAEGILLLGTSMMTLCMACIPLCSALWALALVLAVMGFFMGNIDTVANVAMIGLFGKDVSPFLQALHFFYGAGAFVSPLIARPFLLNEDCSPFMWNASALAEAQEETRVDSAFLLMALTMVPVFLLTCSLVGKRLLRTDAAEQSMAENSLRQKGSRFSVALVASLAALLMFLYDGLQAAYGGYIYSYAVKGPAHFQRSDAAYLNALFWGTFAGGRLFSILLATCLSPFLMLFFNILGCNLSLLVMLCLRYSHVALTVGTCLLGLFMSSVFPTTLSLTEHLIHVTPTITSCLVLGAALGELCLPVIVGHGFSSPTSFLVTGSVLCFISILAYTSLWLMGLTLPKPEATPGILVLFSKYIPATMLNLEEENSQLVHQDVRRYSQMEEETVHFFRTESFQ